MLLFQDAAIMSRGDLMQNSRNARSNSVTRTFRALDLLLLLLPLLLPGSQSKEVYAI